MGWWPFASSSVPSGQAPASSSKPSDLLPSTTSTSEPRANAPKRLTREQQADAELEAFLASLEEGPSYHTKPPSTGDPIPHIPILPPQPSTNPTQTSVPEHPETPSDTKLDISPAALRPRTMSCRAAFDSAFYCASLGGKFNDIYRFGSLQPCSEHWEAFWFCMRNRSIHGEEDKGERIAEYYEAREKRELERRAGGKSSEDVWEIRTEPVEKAFWKVP